MGRRADFHHTLSLKTYGLWYLILGPTRSFVLGRDLARIESQEPHIFTVATKWLHGIKMKIPEDDHGVSESSMTFCGFLVPNGSEITRVARPE